MKKQFRRSFVLAGLVLLALTGCSNSKIDTAQVRSSLQPALDAGQKEQLEMALGAIDAGKYKDALLPLRKIAFGAKLDNDQGKLLKSTLEKVQVNIAKGQ